MRRITAPIPLLFAALLLSAGCAESATPTPQFGLTQSPSVQLIWKTDPEIIVPTAIPFSRYNNPFFFSSSIQPAISNGLVYLTNDDWLASRLYAIDTQTGSIVWQHRAGMSGPGRGISPIVSGDLALFGSVALYAIDSRMGDEQWRYDAGAQITTPSIQNGIVYFGAGETLAEDNTDLPLNGKVHALDVATGTPLWTYSLNKARIRVPPVPSNTTLYFVEEYGSCSETSRLRAIDLVTHQDKWQLELDKGQCVSDQLLIADNIMYLFSRGDKLHRVNLETSGHKTDGDRLYAIDATTGTLVWSYNLGPTLDASPTYTSMYDIKPGIATAPVLHGDKIIFAINADSDSGESGLGPKIQLYILALDAVTGVERWRYEVRDEARITSVRVSSTANSIVFGNFASNQLRALDPSTGQLLWTFETDESPVGPVVEDNGNLYTVDYEGTLYALHVSP